MLVHHLVAWINSAGNLKPDRTGRGLPCKSLPCQSGVMDLMLFSTLTQSLLACEIGRIAFILPCKMPPQCSTAWQGPFQLVTGRMLSAGSSPAMSLADFHVIFKMPKAEGLCHTSLGMCYFRNRCLQELWEFVYDCQGASSGCVQPSDRGT